MLNDVDLMRCRMSDIHSSLQVNVDLFSIMTNSFTPPYWGTNLEHFVLGTKFVQINIYGLFRDIEIEKHQYQAMLDDLVKEVENAELTFKHVDQDSYESDVRCYKNAINYAISEIKKVIEYVPPKKINNTGLTCNIVRKDGSIETYKYKKGVLVESYIDESKKIKDKAEDNE